MKNFTCLFLFLTLFISSCEKTEDINDSNVQLKEKLFQLPRMKIAGKSMFQPELTE